MHDPDYVGVKRIFYEGYPFFVLKVEAPKEVIEQTLRDLYGKTVTLEELIKRLTEIDKNKEVRVSTSFSPHYWWDPDAFGYYAYPAKTLLERVGNVSLEILPFDKSSEKLMWIYDGLGIVAYSEKIVDDEIVAHGEPVAVAILVPRHGREILVFELKDHTVYAYTARPELIDLLEEYGYERVDSFTFKKSYPNLIELANELRDVKIYSTHTGKLVEI